MKNGEMVRRFEEEFAAYVGARYAVALCNGTATLHTALVALGVGPGRRVAVPPLTMSSTTLAVLHAGATPVFVDVDPQTWLMDGSPQADAWDGAYAWMPVSLYGLHADQMDYPGDVAYVDDAAQTLRPHSGRGFTSYSTQHSKILNTGEGGVLVTNDEGLAVRAREFSSLGYRMRADQPRIAPEMLKSPTFDRHHSIGWNYRMNDLTAAEGLKQLTGVDGQLQGAGATQRVERRRQAATMYRTIVGPWPWLTPQHVPEGWQHDYWTYAVACDTPARAIRLADAVVKHGGEKPFPAWRITYQEPAFASLPFSYHGHWLTDGDRHYAVDLCPVAESLQPRLLQFQCNSLSSAERNASALRKAIEEVG